MTGKCNVSSFAKNQLHKSGWVEGKGLGRNEDGMPEAIKVKIKADKTGVGHDPGEQFTFHWWENAFRNSANNIKVTEVNQGVSVETLGVSENVSVTKKSKKLLNAKLHYGGFVKSGTLENGKMLKDNLDYSDVDSSDSEPNSSDKFKPNVLTDEELFAACGGRTAHKGARHGLKLSAKLARLQEQESCSSDSNLKKSDILKSNQNDKMNSGSKISKKKRKKDYEDTEISSIKGKRKKKKKKEHQNMIE